MEFHAGSGYSITRGKLVSASVVAEKVDAIVAWRPLFSRQVIIKKIMVHNLMLPSKGIQIIGDISVDLKAQTVVSDNLLLDWGPTLNFTTCLCQLFCQSTNFKVCRN